MTPTEQAMRELESSILRSVMLGFISGAVLGAGMTVVAILLVQGRLW